MRVFGCVVKNAVYCIWYYSEVLIIAHISAQLFALFYIEVCDI